MYSSNISDNKPTESSSSYVVTIYDEVDKTHHTEIIQAQNAEEALAHASLYDADGEEREEGYRVLTAYLWVPET